MKSFRQTILFAGVVAVATAMSTAPAQTTAPSSGSAGGSARPAAGGMGGMGGGMGMGPMGPGGSGRGAPAQRSTRGGFGGGYGGGMGGMPFGPGGGGMHVPELSDEPREIKVFALRHADPQLAMAMVGELGLPTGGPRCFVDNRTGSLILLGTAEELRVAEQLLEKLDVPAQEQPPSLITQIFSVKYAPAKSLATTLQMLAGNRCIIALDERTNSLIVSGEPSAVEDIKQTIHQLDHPEQQPAADSSERSPYRVRLVWLISGAEGPPMPRDLKDVADELAAIGVEDLRLGAQTLVQALSNDKFKVQCSPTVGNPCRLQLQGELLGSGKNPQLQIDLQVTGSLIPSGSPAQGGLGAPAPPPPPMPVNQALASFDTRLSAPVGHRIVIGVAPTGPTTSVFVVQLLDSKMATPGMPRAR